jgi:peptide/nickel transport system permease protein
MVADQGLREAEMAIQQGDKARARMLLKSILLQEPNNEQGWFLLAQVVKQRRQCLDCLEQVQRLNPKDLKTRTALAYLRNPWINVPKVVRSVEGTVQRRQIKRFYLRDKDGETSPKQGLPEESSEFNGQSGHSKTNWPLFAGLTIVFITVILALAGPFLAPKDPLAMSTLLEVSGKYLTAPYPVFSPGYPLGSDAQGRDLLSRLLWAIRPTMTVVLLVAMVRLCLGTAIGLVAGWSSKWTGRFLDTLISAAISIPVIIVALGGIAAVGIEYGIWAFIAGLSITGWVETARVVRAQTRAVREQVYIEAAHALGASYFQILTRHVLRQISSLLRMLLAFEISNTLMLTAALGFLGYYIGGDVWVEVEDATAAAVSGMPELGQMLATTGVSITHPWSLAILGMVIFVIVLGFNLLGEGLRRRVNLYTPGRTWGTVGWFESLRLWWEDTTGQALARLTSSKIIRPVAMILFFALASIGWLWWHGQLSTNAGIKRMPATMRQKPYWTTPGHDPYGTRWSSYRGPKSSQVAWTFVDESGFPGGPAVSASGVVFVASFDRKIYALEPDGRLRWETLLPETPVAGPSLDREGRVYVADRSGGLIQLSSKGEIIWQFSPQDNNPATSSPVVAPDGKIYYARGRKIQAVSRKGEPLWQAQPSRNASPEDPPRLSPDAQFLFWGESVVRVEDGSKPNDDLPVADRYLSGADGRIYLVNGHIVSQWEPGSAGSPDSITWDHSKFTVQKIPEDAGVTPDGITWLFYTAFARSWGYGEDERLIWLDADSQVMGNVHYPTRNSQVIGVDLDAVVYTCGNLEFGYGDPECQALSPKVEEPLWRFSLPGSSEVSGGALVPGRLYVTGREGYLYALGKGDLTPKGVAFSGVDSEEKAQNTPEIGIRDYTEEPIGPRNPASKVIFEAESGFTGGPAVTPEGEIFIASRSGYLYHLDLNGEIVWQYAPPETPVGAPSVNRDGRVYLVDKAGGLSALDPDGQLLWRYQPEAGLRGISGPVLGSDGTIYYTVGTPSRGSIQAVDADGDPVWLSQTQTDLFYTPLEVSPRGDYIFLREDVLDAQSGELQDFDLDFEAQKYFVGKDGFTYLLAEGTIVNWRPVGSGIQLAEQKVLSPQGEPSEVGVTAQGMVWMAYVRNFLWFDKNGEAWGASAPDAFLRKVIGVDRNLTAYVCTSNQKCLALRPGSDQPIWEIQLGEGYFEVNGGALVESRIYISTEQGQLFVIE